MLYKCAKFHGDSPSGLKVKFKLARAIELSETADFVYNFVYKPYASKQLLWHTWPTFPSKFFYKMFEDASVPLLYHGGKMSKMTKNFNQGGRRLKRARNTKATLSRWDTAVSMCTWCDNRSSRPRQVNAERFACVGFMIFFKGPHFPPSFCWQIRPRTSWSCLTFLAKKVVSAFGLNAALPLC